MTTALPAQATPSDASLPDMRHLRLVGGTAPSGTGEHGAVPLVGYLVFVPEGTDPAQLFANDVPRPRIRPIAPTNSTPVRQTGGGAVRIDPARHVAEVDGRELDLTYLEFGLLAHLVRHPHQVHSREQLMAGIWGYDHIGDGRTVDVHIARLRRKLGRAHRQRIVTIRRWATRTCPTSKRPSTPHRAADLEETTAMGVATAPSGPAPESGRTGPGRAHWLRVARETADDLATDAVAREQAGKAPFDEVSRLREAGLLTLLVPARLGGGGADWPTAYAIVREIAAADGAIGQLLGGHYFLSWSAGFFTDPARAARTERQSVAEQWCWGGGFARREPPLTLARTTGGHVLDGRHSYATGVLVADRLAVRAVRADTGEPLAVVVDPARHGVRIEGDAGTFGQRLAAGGSVEFDAVPVAPHDVLGSLSADEDVLSPLTALASPVGRLLSAQLLLGLAEGVLAEAREYSRAGHSPWHPAWPAGSPEDPHMLTAYGELTVLTRSASALTEQALEAVQRGLEHGEDLTYDEYADISVLVAMAEAAASRAAQESTTRALDIVGSRSASSRLGFDRFWRNARTHTLYGPATHRLHDVGDYFLNGAHPPFVLPA